MKIGQLPTSYLPQCAERSTRNDFDGLFVTFLSVLIEPSGVTATTREAEEQDSSSGEESTMQ